MLNPRTHLEFTFESAQQYIDTFAELLDNWDGYKGEAITSEAITGAKDLLLSVCSVPQPIPLPDGGIDLLWLWHGQEVSIRIGSDGKLAYDA